MPRRSFPDDNAPKRHLNVFITSPYGLSGRGGIDRLVDLIAEELQKLDQADVHLTRLVTRGRGHIAVSPILFSFAVARFLIAAKRQQVDLLHVNLASRGSTYRKILLARLSKICKIPYIVHLHGGMFDRFWSESGTFTQRLIRELFQGSASIIVLGQNWRRLLSERLPFDASKIVVLPNATKAASRRPLASPGSPLQITFLGKLGWEKGTDVLVETLAQLGGRSDWIATIAGNGRVSETRRHVELVGLGSRIQIPGWLEAAEVDKLLGTTDVLVLPSRVENQPIAILEAFARGIAAIATPVGSIGELIKDGQNGILVRVGDSGALAAGISRVLDDPDLRARLGASAFRDHTQHYELASYVKKLVTIWRGVAAVRE